MTKSVEEVQIGPAPAFLSHPKQELYVKENSLLSREIGKSHYQLAKVFYDKSDLIEAEKNFLAALKYTETPGDIFSMLKILGFLIRIASEKLEDEKAVSYITQAEELIEQLTNVLGSLNSEYFYNLGLIKNYSGSFSEAKENFLIAYKKSKEENEPELLAKCLLALAILFYNNREFKTSLDYLAQLEELLKILNKTYLQGAMYHFYAKIYLEENEFDKSLEYFSLANKSLQEKKCWNLLGYVLLGRGILHKKRGEFDKSLVYFQFAKESTDAKSFKRLYTLIQNEIQDVNDSSVDLYLDRTNRKVHERHIGVIDFKHRFVLLEILFLLAKNAGSYFDKEDLAKSIWKDEYNPLIHDKLIYTSVSRLRKLIEPKVTGENDKKIKSDKRKYILRGKDGYTFNPGTKIRFHMDSKFVVNKTIANVEISSPV